MKIMTWIFQGKQLFLRKTDLSLLASKLIEKIPDSCHAKEHYQLVIKKKNAKSVKQSETITY